MYKHIKIITYTSLALLALAMLSLYFFLNPSKVDLFPQCYFHKFTGLHCPGCGSQRAIHALLHGDIWKAIQHNFLIILAFLLLVYKLFLWAFPYRKKLNRKRKNVLYANATPWIVLAIVVLFWILRNLPGAPFTFLAP